MCESVALYTCTEQLLRKTSVDRRLECDKAVGPRASFNPANFDTAKFSFQSKKRHVTTGDLFCYHHISLFLPGLRMRIVSPILPQHRYLWYILLVQSLGQAVAILILEVERRVFEERLSGCGPRRLYIATPAFRKAERKESHTYSSIQDLP